jgi:hypothetical protein
LRQRYRYVGFATSEGRHEPPGLQDAFLAWRRQPQHDFTESYSRLCHIPDSDASWFVFRVE